VTGYLSFKQINFVAREGVGTGWGGGEQESTVLPSVSIRCFPKVNFALQLWLLL
jgi:hypothetical protein